jgi:WD40 repeat protein
MSNTKNTRFGVALLAALGLCACGALNPGRELPTVQYQHIHSGAEALDFDAASDLLASGGWDGDVALWRPGEAKPLLRFQAHDSPVRGIAFTEKWLVTAGSGGLLRAWDRGGTPAAERDTGFPIDRMIADGDRIITAHADGALRFWRLPRLQPQGQVLLHHGRVTALAAHAPSGRIASGGYDGRVFLLETNQPARELAAPPTDARSLTFAPDGNRLYGGGWFRMFRWDLANGGLDVISTDHWGVISSMKFAAGGNAIASISRVNDSAVLFLDPESGETLRDLRRHPVCGTTLALSPDGRYLANTGDDGIIRIFDLENPRLR